MDRFKVIVIALVLIGCGGCFQFRIPGRSDQAAALKLIDTGTLNLRAGNLEEALGDFELSRELYETPQALDGLGCVALRAGDYKKAEALFVAAYDLDPDYSNSIGNLALLYEMIGNEKLAAELHYRAVAENPGNFRFRNNFAAYVNDQGMRDVARAELIKAQALAPHPVVAGNIARIKRE